MRWLALVGLLGLTACGSSPAEPAEDHRGQLHYFEYTIPDGGVVRCLERWPNNSAAVMDCSWPAPVKTGDDS